MKIKDLAIALKVNKKNRHWNQLTTSWGEKILHGEQQVTDILTEYPRPQMRRSVYTILNGMWKYAITRNDSFPQKMEGEILVPFSPEAFLSGVNRQLKPNEYLWYEKEIAIESIPTEKRLLLQFGAVDQGCTVYVNHTAVGGHNGGYLPFTLDITSYIVAGKNTITVRVWDLSDTSYHARGKQRLENGGMFYTAQSGIWQTVWMEWVPNLYIESIKITPLFDEDSICLEIKDNLLSNETIKVTVMDGEQKIYDDSYNEHKIIIPIQQKKEWTPEDPYLYGLQIKLGQDTIESYFAMRKVEVKPDEKGIVRIYLNDKPYYQRGVLDQGYWPDGLYTAPSDEAMVFDIMKMKELGFNMIRKHVKVEPLRWYYHCDRLGMLVWQDIVNGGTDYHMLGMCYALTVLPMLGRHVADTHYSFFSRKSEDGRTEWLNECKETVQSLYNCPSIILWVPFNEGWGQFDTLQVVDMIRKEDGTRLIDHASGWFDQKGGDIASVHNYFRKLKVKKDHRAFALTEFGGYACYIEKHSYSDEIFGYRNYETMEELSAAYEELYSKEVAPLIKEGLCATVYTQLSDVEEEVNGLFTYDRKVCKVVKGKR